jgi:hypothetical protein
MPTLADLADNLNMTEKALIKLTTDFEPFYSMYEDKEIGGIYSTVYTDGDGGLMLFEGYCGMFAEHGVAVHFIHCTYCDIPYSIMNAIMRELEEANNSGDFE